MADKNKDTMIREEDVEKHGYVDRAQHEEQEQDKKSDEQSSPNDKDR